MSSIYSYTFVYITIILLVYYYASAPKLLEFSAYLPERERWQVADFWPRVWRLLTTFLMICDHVFDDFCQRVLTMFDYVLDDVWPCLFLPMFNYVVRQCLSMFFEDVWQCVLTMLDHVFWQFLIVFFDDCWQCVWTIWNHVLLYISTMCLHTFLNIKNIWILTMPIFLYTNHEFWQWPFLLVYYYVSKNSFQTSAPRAREQWRVADLMCWDHGRGRQALDRLANRPSVQQVLHPDGQGGYIATS
jgi:hypothetical protein